MLKYLLKRLGRADAAVLLVITRILPLRPSQPGGQTPASLGQHVS